MENMYLFLRLQLTAAQELIWERAVQLVSGLVAASRYPSAAWDPIVLSELLGYEYLLEALRRLYFRRGFISMIGAML